MAKQTVTAQREERARTAEESISAAIEIVSGLFTEMEEIKDNMEEKFSQTDKYQRLEELVYALEQTNDALETAQSNMPSDFQYT